jgi:hypothetical protein
MSAFENSIVKYCMDQCCISVLLLSIELIQVMKSNSFGIMK